MNKRTNNRAKPGKQKNTESCENFETFCADCGSEEMDVIHPWCAHARVITAHKASEIRMTSCFHGQLLRRAHETRAEIDRALAGKTNLGMSRTKTPANVVLLFPTEAEERRAVVPAKDDLPLTGARRRVYDLRRWGRSTGR